MENLQAVFDIIMTLLAISGGGSVLAASATVGKVLKYAPAVKTVVNVIACNFGEAKNEKDK